VSYLIANKTADLYGAIAVFDPKIGRPGYKTYIIAVTHTPAFAQKAAGWVRSANTLLNIIDVGGKMRRIG
jgi:hypothetical protein